MRGWGCGWRGVEGVRGGVGGGVRGSARGRQGDEFSSRHAHAVAHPMGPAGGGRCARVHAHPTPPPLTQCPAGSERCARRAPRPPTPCAPAAQAQPPFRRRGRSRAARTAPRRGGCPRRAARRSLDAPGWVVGRGGVGVVWGWGEGAKRGGQARWEAGADARTRIALHAPPTPTHPTWLSVHAYPPQKRQAHPPPGGVPNSTRTRSRVARGGGDCSSSAAPAAPAAAGGGTDCSLPLPPPADAPAGGGVPAAGVPVAAAAAAAEEAASPPVREGAGVRAEGAGVPPPGRGGVLAGGVPSTSIA